MIRPAINMHLRWWSVQLWICKLTPGIRICLSMCLLWTQISILCSICIYTHTTFLSCVFLCFAAAANTVMKCGNRGTCTSDDGKTWKMKPPRDKHWCWLSNATQVDVKNVLSCNQMAIHHKHVKKKHKTMETLQKTQANLDLVTEGTEERLLIPWKTYCELMQ